MEKPDQQGNVYLGNFETLYSVFGGQESIEIKSSCTKIFGESESKYAFQNCFSTIKFVTFQPNSQLQQILPYSFFKCSRIESLDLSQCTKLEILSKEAFKQCTSLGTINLPESLHSIMWYCFWYSGLISIKIPKSVVYIDTGAFASCSKLKTLIFENDINLTTIFQYTFEGTIIETLNLPKSLTSIVATAFRPANHMSSITAEGNPFFTVENGLLCQDNGTTLVMCPPALTTGTINIPDNVVTIKANAFHSCKATQIILNSKLLTVEEYGFRESKITSITIPANVKTLKEGAFYSCSQLTQVTLIEGSMTALSKQLFYNVPITTISIPNSIDTIEQQCFDKCGVLGKVEVPKSVVVLKGGAFSGCPKLELSFETGSKFSIDEQFIIMSDSNTKLCQYLGKEPNQDLTILSSVTHILASSFAGNAFITSLIFKSDSKLDTIEENAFDGCVNLKSINIPDSLVYINQFAFRSSGLTTIKFGTHLQRISNNAFEFCNSLTTVTFSPVDVNIALEIQKKAFKDCNQINTMTFCEGLEILGEEFAINIKPLKTIQLPLSLKTIGKRAFYHSSLESVTFPEGTSNLDSIADETFYNSNNLTSFQFAEGIVSLGSLAFSKTALENVVISNTLSTIKSQCFRSCKELTSFSTGSESILQFIENGVFEDCPKLQKIDCNNNFFKTSNSILYNAAYTNIIAFPPAATTQFLCIPRDVVVIGPSAFYACSNIYSVTIPDDSKLTTIGAFAFAECTTLRTINLLEKITDIGANVFSGCTSLSCGLVILNTTESYKNNLIDLAKMPKRCFDSCVKLNTPIPCFHSRQGNFLSLIAAFLFISN